MPARKLVADSEIRRVLTLAQEHGIAVAGLDVGPDYVRVLPPAVGGDSLEQYIGTTHRSKAARARG